MKKFSKSIGFYLVIIAIGILIAQYIISPTQPEEELLYSQFIDRIEEGRIEKVTIIGDNLIEGTTAEGQEFEINVPGNLIEEMEHRLRDNNVGINTEPEPEPPWWTSMFAYLLPTVILIGAWIFIMKRMQGGGKKMMSFGENKAQLQSEGETGVDFDDVANYEEVKEELQEVVEFLRNPGKFSRLGAEIPKGVLLLGPPGTGKTLMARAVSGEAEVPFFFISGSDFVEMFVGVGASRVRDLFEKGKENAPCIIFIDELDAVGRQRGAGVGGGNDEREQTLNQLLVEMDGFEPNEGIIIMGATNRPDVLDPALLRPGRFDRQIIVDKPDYRARKGILEVHVQDKPLKDDVNLDVLARRTPGFTGADIENLANEAAILAARRDKEKIGMLEFDDSIDRVIAGPKRESRVMSEREQNIISFHETGHALLGELLENADPTHKVTIIPRGRAGGFTINLPEEDKQFITKQELMDKIASLLGGRVAEELFLEDISTGAQNDLDRATKIARGMVTDYGMSEEIGPLSFGKDENQQVFLGRDISKTPNYSEEVAASIDKEIRKITEGCYQRARRILSENEDMVREMVERLKEEETLQKEDIKEIISNYKPDFYDDEDEEEIEETEEEKAEEEENEVEKKDKDKETRSEEDSANEKEGSDKS